MSFTPSVRAQVVTRRTYNRPKNDEGTEFENWDETIDRVISHQRWLWERAANRDLLADELAELDELRDLYLNRKVLPSGRTLWLGGTPISRTRESSQFNCSFSNTKSVYDVVDHLWLLLQGCGVGHMAQPGVLNGFSKVVETIDVIRSTLTIDDWNNGVRGSEVNKEFFTTDDNGKLTWTLQVGDSAEAWAKSLGKILAMKRPVDHIVLDFSQIRAGGIRLRGYGWISSGDEQISSAYKAICELMSKRANKLLTRIDILDIENWMGTMLSSRRSAEIALCPYGDEEWEQFALAKNNYDVDNPQRGQSNNSLVFYQKPSKAELYGIFSLMQMAGGCLPPWATLLTPTGLRPLADVNVGDKIWSKEGWTTIKNKWSTGVKDVFEYKTTAGTLFATDNHRVVVDENNTKVSVGNADHLMRLSGPTDNNTYGVIPEAVVSGLLIGDGVKHHGRAKNCMLYIGKDDEDYFSSEIAPYISYVGCKRDNGYVMKTDLNPIYLVPKHKIEVPEDILHAGCDYVASFLRGLFSANGHVSLSSESLMVKLSCTSPVLRDQVILMLGSLGIRSRYVTKKATTRTMTNRYGHQCEFKVKTSYEVRITVDVEVFAAKIGFIQHYKQDNLSQLLARKAHSGVNSTKRAFDIRSVDLVSTEEVFDIEVDNESHTFWCNGFDISNSEPGFINGEAAKKRAPWFAGANPCVEILLGDKSFCNLAEVVLPKFNGDFGGLKRAIYVAGRANYRQTCVNLKDGILSDSWHELNEFLRLCGVGLTGIVQWERSNDAKSFRELRERAESGAYSMADDLGLPRPKNVTCIKPSGTLSRISDCTEGVHKPLAKYIFNKIGFSKYDPLVDKLRAANYDVMDHPYDSSAVLVTFPVAYEDVEFDSVEIEGLGTVEVNLESAVSQLERYKMMMTEYVTQNCSNTISYSPDEVPSIVDWLYANWDHYVGVSFLYRNDPTKTAKDLGYPYLPQETKTKAEYDNYVSQLLPLSLDNDNSGFEIQSEECAGGMCPVR